MRTSALLVAVALAGLWTAAEAGTNCTPAAATKNCIDGLIVPIW